MIIVIDLMRNIFIIMFFVLMALEVIVLISITTLYNIPLKKNQPNVEAVSLNNTKEVLSSFNNILTRKYYNIETDLILIAKHLHPMYLTQEPLVETAYPKLLPSSKFYKSYKDCLQSGASFNESSFVKTYSPNDTSMGYDLLGHIIQKNNNFKDYKEDDFIDSLFKESSLNYISYYPDYSNDDGGSFKNVANMETYVCYSISIFKTLLMKNLIFDKGYPITNKFYLFLNDRFIFQYPLDYLDQKTVSALNYYRPTQPGCVINYGGFNCFDTFNNFNAANNFDIKKDIYFDLPAINNNRLVGRGCININFSTFPNVGNSNFACIDFNIDNILRKVTIGANNLVNLLLVSFENDDFNLHYTNIVDLKNFTRSIYNSTLLGNFKLTDDSGTISMFHGIYYNIFNSDSDAVSTVANFIAEYQTLVGKLKGIMSQFNNKSQDCDSYDIIDQNITLSHSFLMQQNDLNLNESKIKINILVFNSTIKDTFQFVLYPIKLNHTSFNNTNYIFQNECSSRILYYSIAMVRVGSETIPNEIYFILILKSIRNWFFFVSLLLFANIVYFILCEIYVKYLVSPIKNIRHSLERLIKERNLQEGEESNDKEKFKENNIDPVSNKELNDNKGTELTLYRNKETKKLEDLLNFLKKIVIMKQAHGNTDFKVQSKIYAKFLGFLDTLEEKEHYRQCLLIIAYSKYKDKSFSDAYDALEILKKSTHSEEADLLSKNDSLEQKIINLPSQMINNLIPYLNEFTDNEISSDQDLNKLIKLRVFNQKILYFYGLIKFLDFYKKKQDYKDKNYSKKDRYEKMKEEYGLLEDAIVHLKKALQVNHTMNFNQIKSIFILILISKCCFYSEDYNEATNCLKEALLKFSDLNKYFFNKYLSEQIDPRVMFVTNGIIMEQILFYLGRVCEKIGKKQLAGWIFNKLMEISYFRTNEIHRKASHKLNKFLFEKENNFLEKKLLLDKVCRRLRKNPANKKLTIVISENLLKNFNSTYELKEVLMKCLENYINQFDLVSFFQFDTNIQSFIVEAAKAYNLKIFADSPSFCKYTGNLDKEKPDFYKAMDTAVNILTKDEGFYAERGHEAHDKYIFTFIYSEDFRFASKEENRSLARRLIENNISLYTFCFDDNLSDKKMLNIKRYLKDLVEGYLILVKNFKIIKQAFQNISNKGIQKNILESNYENHKFII